MSDGVADIRPTDQSSRGRSINETFVRCLDLYRSLASYILENNSSNTIGADEIGSGRLLDEFGRLRIWGEQTKAALKPKARSSLDEFLRNEKRLSDEVKEVLGQLEIGLSMAVSTIRDDGPVHSAHYGDLSDLTVSHSDHSSESGSETSGDSRSGRPNASRLATMISHIFEYIQLLYHFGSLLRRPGLKGRYLRHTDSADQQSTIFFDARHIEEKLRHWDRQAAGGVGILPEEEEAVTEQTISERLARELENSPHHVLSRRFAKANAQRREQLKYWIDNPYQPDVSHGPETNKVVVGKSLLKKNPTKGGAATEDETAESKEAKSEKSRSTAISFTTVAESALLDSATEMGRPQTIYAESVVAGKWSARVPPPPKPAIVIDGTEQYECPYCHINLDSKVAKDRMAWKRHVFRDLRPYSCTFVHCANPNKLYTTRHEWRYHEMQIHRRNWVCHKCDCKFDEKDELVRHLRDSHSGNWTDRQLSVILEMSERPMDESVILPCSLCKSQLSLAKLLDHLAAHMEEIALFVLPNNSEPGDETNSNDAMRTDTQNGSENREPSQLSSLVFSDVAQSPISPLPASTPSDGTDAEVEDREPSLRSDLESSDIAQISNPPLPAATDSDGAESAVDELPSPQSPHHLSDIVESDGEELESEDSVPDSQLPAATPSHRAEAEVEGENEASSSISQAQPDASLVPDIDSIIDQLLEARAYTPGRKVDLKIEVIQYLCAKSKDIFLSQPVLLELDAPVKIVGDIRGQYYDLLVMFEYNGFPPEANYLFMGNYVDIEGVSIETICLLLAYKIKYPENFFLLRGNHEADRFNVSLGFYSECRARYDSSTWRAFNDVFDCLPVAAIVDDKIFVVHGGLSPGLNSMEQIRQLARPVSVSFDDWFLRDLLLATPSNDIVGWSGGQPEKPPVFGPDTTLAFLKKHHLELVCRGHEVVQEGYEYSANKQLVTIFSAPNYGNRFNNAAAVMYVDESSTCSFKVMRHENDGEAKAYEVT